MRTVLGLAVALALGACGAQQSQEMSDEAVETSSVEASATTDAASPASPPPPIQARAAGTAPPSADAPPPGAAPLLAYSYSYSIEAPPAGVTALLRRHEQACQAAGPLTCQVVGSSTAQAGDDELSAQLTFRATPAYVQRFRNGLNREVQGARGEVASSEVDTEDLTRSIIDTEARLRAGRLLRTRLEALIASRPGNLEQLLEIERELARVGGEIDAAESTLAVMRARVSMSTVTLTYGSTGALVNPGDSRPLADAADSFARNLAASAAAILTFVSIVLPWALVLGLAVWGVSHLVRRNRRRAGSKPPRPGPAPAAAPEPSRPPSDG